MRFFISEIILLLITATAALTGEKIDTSVLKSCRNSEECLPWQVCATCTSPILWGILGAHITNRWCSDVNDFGICDYGDDNLSCSCNEDEETHQKRLALLDAGSNLPQLFCKDDAVCRQFVPNSRCSHCAYTTKARDLTVIINACTSPPEEDPASFCDKSQLWMCSCGQRFPAAVQLGPAPTQSRKPQQQKQQQQLITAANPPDLTQAETVDLSTWPKQAVLGGGVGGGDLPAAEAFASSSWTQDTAGPATGEGDNLWTGEGYDSFST